MLPAAGPRPRGLVATAFGLGDWMGKDFDDSLDAVWERIGVNSENSMPSLRDERFREGLAKLGWDSQVMQRNAVGCTRGDLRAVPLRLPAPAP